ncbi:hypothetical protein M569_16564 [Genlisea aurea]|uniref:Uncharacterized protein n=1 Tax=Genlisea aurea TaxID=192259 RepID=S8C1B7_9LAMI|nr:hypothetical protein M569_16564 [Genlisea aurea]
MLLGVRGITIRIRNSSCRPRVFAIAGGEEGYGRISDYWGFYCVMDDDWGNLPTPRPNKNWDDEDVDDKYVKECWEDESLKESSEDNQDEPNPPEPAGNEEDPDHKSTDENTLDDFSPKTASDFAEYGELLARKLRQYEKSCHYVELLKSLLRSSLSSSRGSDVEEVASTLNAIADEKMKAEAKKRAVGKRNVIADDSLEEYDDEHDFV